MKINRDIWESEDEFIRVNDEYEKQKYPNKFKKFKYEGLSRRKFSSIKNTHLAKHRKKKKDRKIIKSARIRRRKTDYKKYLKSNLWKNTRERFIKSKFCNNKCIICKATKNLQIHHRDYGHLGKERFIDLFQVCGNCHMKLHGMKNCNNKPTTLKWYLRLQEEKLLGMKYEKYLKALDLQKDMKRAIMYEYNK